LAVVNPKGGVAKTTTSLNVAFALAELQRQRVILVDMDGQGSLTTTLPPPAPPLPRGAPKPASPPRDSHYISDYFRGEHILSDLVRPTRFPGLWLIPSEQQLYRLQLAGGNRAHAELRFVEDLRTLSGWSAEIDPAGAPFNWIVLDTPAGDTFYSRAALAAADYVLIPAYAETFASNGIQELLTAARTMGALAGNVEAWKERILGCVITRWKDGRNARDNATALRLLLGNEGVKVFADEIPQDERVETANRGTTYGGTQGLFHLGRQLGPAARAYDHLVEEILKHVHDHEAKADH
jgi:chromosome partitioning protein